MNITTTPKYEIILTLGINFLSDFIPMFSFMAYMITEEDSFLFAAISFMIILLRVIVLPIYYHWLEKRTQNEAIKSFIEKLRHNIKIKLIMLFPISYFCTYISISIITKDLSFIFLDIDGLSLASTFLGAMGNYLVLFTYWFIVDLYKKIRHNH